MSFAPRTTKPEESEPIAEPTGPVAADSLAAESNKAGGGFSENENVAQLSVKGASSTLANTDTSGATALHAAPDGATRAKEDAKGLGSDERGVSGVKYPDAAANQEFDGTHSQEGYVGGPSADQTSTTTAPSHAGATGDSFASGGAGLTGTSTSDSQISSGAAAGKLAGNTSSGAEGSSGSGSGGNAADSTPNVETAPNYAATVAGTIRSEGELQPKGKDLVEGDIPQTKTFTGNVGGDKDPGRLAEQKFEKINADTVGGAPGSKGSGDSENPFGVLESERA